MRLEERQLRTLYPSEGHVLTQNRETPDGERVFASFVQLGSMDSAENWREVTEAEAEVFRERVRREREAAAAEAEREKRRRELEAELAMLDGGGA